MERVLQELALAVLAGAAMVAGVRLSERLQDPYSEPRLTLKTLLDSARGGDSA